MEETFGARIRQFLKELFGSRYTEHLENEIAILRQDHDRIVHDRDILIAALREEKQQLMSKIAVYELSLMPRASRAGAEVVAYQKPAAPKPKFSSFDMPPTKSRWQQFQDDYYKQQEEEEKKAAATAAKE